MPLKAGSEVPNSSFELCAHRNRLNWTPLLPKLRARSCSKACEIKISTVLRTSITEPGARTLLMRNNLESAMTFLRTKLLLASFSTLGCNDQLFAQTSFRRLPSSQARQLVETIQRDQFPRGAVLKSSPKNVYVLRAAGLSDLIAIPVTIRYPVNGDLRMGCGFYFIDSTQHSHYTQISTNPAEDCVDITAVGAASDALSHPRLIAIYTAPASVNGVFTEPVVLSWDRGQNSYRVDSKTTEWLSLHANVETISRIRRLLITRK